MKIAATYENGNIFQHFGKTAQFKLYEIENGKILSAEVVDTNGSEIVARGPCEGKIGYEERGTNGFGYDPLFFPEGSTRTLAEYTEEEKNAISHRADAYRKALEFVEDEMSILDDDF